MGRIYRQEAVVRDPVTREPLRDAEGNIRKKPRSKHWWISFYSNGRRYYESSGSELKSAAAKLLRKREGKVADGEAIAPYLEKLTFDQAMLNVVADQRMKDRRSVEDTERRIRLHLKPYFSVRYPLMLNVTSSDITAYKVKRKDEDKAKPATINRELAILKRAFRLGLRDKKLTSAPHIEMFEEDNVRQVFWERGEFEEVRRLMPAHMRTLITFYFWCGWRKVEVLSLERHQLDVANGVVRLSSGQSKNKKDREVDFSGIEELAKGLRQQEQSAKRLTRRLGRMVTTVFHEPDGKPITVYSLRRAWEKARVAAGYPGKWVHDFRRTAARNLVRSGVSQTVSMKVTGHKTPAMFSRYDITSGEDLKLAGERVNEYVTTTHTGARPGKVRQFQKQQGG